MARPASSNLAPDMNVTFNMNHRPGFFPMKTVFAGLALSFFALTSLAQTLSPFNLPLYFEANNNQTEFRSTGSGYQFLISSAGVQITLHGPAGSAAVQMELAGANTQAQVQGEGELPGKINYLVGQDSSKWQTGLPTFSKVRLSEIYPGINLVFYGNLQQLEYDFAVAPGADPNVIRIHFQGVDKISITPRGGLVLQIGAGEICQPEPEIYQTIAGTRKIIPGGYKILDAQTVAFEIGNYDHSLPLVIDPVLTYSAYFGSDKSSIAWGIARDPNGFIFIAGQTFSKNYSTAGAFQTNFGGGRFVGDAFVAKFDSTCTNLIYLTYLGGESEDAALSIAVDGNSDAYITGYTQSTNFPVIASNAIPGHAQISGKFDPNVGRWPADVFVTELGPNGTNLIYSTFLGGDSTDVGYGIALDSSTNIYVTGMTYSTNFPFTSTALQTRLACSNNFYLNANAFVTEIPNGGGNLVYSTYLGGTNYDVGRAITVDPSDNVYVAGFTISTNFPTWNIPDGLSHYLNGVTNKNNHNDNSYDAFVTKFPPLGPTSLPSYLTNAFYSIFLGGTNSEIAYSIAADSSGYAYVTGYTTSTNFPVTNNPPGLSSYLRTNGFSSPIATNVFVTKLAPNGPVVDSTMFGGRGVDIGYGVAVDAGGDVFVVGGETSDRTNFPTMNFAYPLSQTNTGGFDVFVAAISNDWSRMYYSVCLGGKKDDRGYGIVVDPSTNVFITGATVSTNFPTENAGRFWFNGTNVISGTNYIDGTLYTGTTNDAFLTEIALGTLPSGPIITNALPPAQTNGLDTTFTLTINAIGTSPLVYQWQMTNFATGSLTNLDAKDKKRFTGTTSNSLTILDAQLTNSGTYFVIVTNNWGAVTDSVDLTILSFPPEITVPPTNQTVNEGDTVIFPVTVTGTLPLHYQWQFNGTDITDKSPFSGTQTGTLQLVNAQTTNAGTYSIIVTNVYGAITDSVTLTVLTFPPAITNAPPQFQTNGLNTTFALTINASGSPPLSYQWQLNGVNLTTQDKDYIGINSNSLTIKDAQTNQSGDYTVIVTNSYGSATTNVNVTIQPFAPQITVPPTNQTADVGNLAYFQVEVTGTTPLYIQWQKGGTNLPNKSPYIGVNTTTLIFTNIQLNEAGTYSIIVTNNYGAVTDSAILTVLSLPPVITNAPPLFQTNGIDTTFALTVNASGSLPLIYQWQHNGTNLTATSYGYIGANTNSLTILDAQTNQGGDYTVIVTNSYGSATTNVNVTIMAFPPQITVPPTNETVGIGNTATFPITATGTPALRYQWQRDGTNLLDKGNISGVDTATLQITKAETNDSGTISIIVTNNYGAVTDSVTLTILPLPPQITVPPTNEISGLGGIVTFNVTATGSLPLFYQWQTNGVNLSASPHYGGVNTNSFTITNTQPVDSGIYEIVVTNAFGSASTNATLTVLTAPVMTLSLTSNNIADGVTFSVVGGTNGGTYNLYGTTNLLYTPVSTTWSNLATATVTSQGSFSAPLPISLFDPTNPEEFFILQQQ
jgi:hypothetical protein